MNLKVIYFVQSIGKGGRCFECSSINNKIFHKKAFQVQPIGNTLPLLVYIVSVDTDGDITKLLLPIHHYK